MTGHDTDSRIGYADRGLRFVILAGMATVVGLVGIVTVGMAARVEWFSTASIMQLLLVGVLLWPVYRLAPWRPGATERVRDWSRSNRVPLGVAALLVLGSRLPFAPDPLAALVNLPLARTAGFFFGAELFYRPHVGFELAMFVRRFAQWYVTVLFLFAISALLVDVGTTLWSSIAGNR